MTEQESFMILIRSHFLELLKIPTYCNELSEWKKVKIWEYARALQSDSIDKITAIARANPSQPFEFWQERNGNYQEAVAVIRILEADAITKGIKSKFNPVQLEAIFKKLLKKEIFKSSDEKNFLAIFGGNQKKLVYWNHSIRGAKAGLFDLMQRISETDFSASEMKKYFVSDTPIHDKWKDKNGLPTKLIDEMLQGI